MQPLIQAVLNRISGDSALSQIAGTTPTVYLSRAPETAAMPLITLHVAAGTPGLAGAHDFAGDRITPASLTLTCVADALTTALAMADQLTTLLDAASFPLSAGTLLDCRQTAAPQPALAGFDAANTEVYHVEVKFICSVFNAAGA